LRRQKKLDIFHRMCRPTQTQEFFSPAALALAGLLLRGRAR